MVLACLFDARLAVPWPRWLVQTIKVSAYLWFCLFHPPSPLLSRSSIFLLYLALSIYANAVVLVCNRLLVRRVAPRHRPSSHSPVIFPFLLPLTALQNVAKALKNGSHALILLCFFLLIALIMFSAAAYFFERGTFDPETLTWRLEDGSPRPALAPSSTVRSGSPRVLSAVAAPHALAKSYRMSAAWASVSACVQSVPEHTEYILVGPRHPNHRRLWSVPCRLCAPLRFIPFSSTLRLPPSCMPGFCY